NLLVREQSGVLKYEFHVRPGADPSDIRLLYGGADGLSIDRSGALAIDTAAGVVHDAAPVAFQEWNGARNAVQIRYALEGSGRSGREGTVGVGHRWRVRS